MISSEETAKIVNELNYAKKMQDLDYQIKIAEAKKLDETAKAQEKASTSGNMQYMNTPTGERLPLIDMGNQAR